MKPSDGLGDAPRASRSSEAAGEPLAFDASHGPTPSRSRVAMTLPLLDLLRWLSAFAVAIGHLRDLLLVDYAGIGHHSLPLAIFYFVTGFGREAVVVFFVLSGFLVGGRLLTRPLETRADAARYLIDRFTRIYIVLIPALAISLAVAAYAQRQSGAAIFNSTDWSSSLNFDFRARVSPAVVLCNLANLQTAACEPLGHDSPLWSLAFEWFYYLTFPLLLWGLDWPRFRLGLGRMVGVVALCALGILAFPGAMVSFPLWIMGALSALMRQSWTASRFLLIVSLGCFLLALVASRIGATGGAMSDYLIAAPLAVCLLRPDFFYAKSERISPWLAGFSYSLYVVHFPLCVLFIGMFELVYGVQARLMPEGASFLLFAGVLAAIYGAAWAVSLVTEKKTVLLRRWLTARLVEQR